VIIDDTKFNHIRELIPTKKIPEQKTKRQNLFSLFDRKNLGYLTEEDMRYGIINILKLGEVCEAEDAISTAYRSSCGAVKFKNKSTDLIQNSTIQFQEFRIFFVYLRQYFEFYLIYKKIDNNGDGKLSLKEFTQVIPALNK